MRLTQSTLRAQRRQRKMEKSGRQREEPWEGRIRIWGRIWAMALETWREMVEWTAQGRRSWENAQKDI